MFDQRKRMRRRKGRIDAWLERGLRRRSRSAEIRPRRRPGPRIDVCGRRHLREQGQRDRITRSGKPSIERSLRLNPTWRSRVWLWLSRRRRCDWENVSRQAVTRLKRLIRRRNSATRTAVPAIHRQWKVASVAIETAPGELLDKLAILEIKRERVNDPGKLSHVCAELAALAAARSQAIPDSPELAKLSASLKAVNEELWDVEDEIRRCDRDHDFGPRFIELARSVYRHNDHRAALKRKINELLGSTLIEEKEYVRYENLPSPSQESREGERTGL